ncbi:unnamed protein product [Aspergillus oryzae]|nr:unnamed protein product [Aspergillus oryzae]
MLSSAELQKESSSPTSLIHANATLSDVPFPSTNATTEIWPELDGITSTKGSFYGYLKSNDVTSRAKALDLLDAYIKLRVPVMVISPSRKVPKLRALRRGMNGKLICIPTVHIWGRKDATIELSKGGTSAGDEEDGLDAISGLRV